MINPTDAQHAANAVGTLISADPGDPRLSRTQFVQAAHRIAEFTVKSETATQALIRLHDAIHAQVIDADCVHAAAHDGYPILPGVDETPANLVRTVGRLYAHASLIRPDFEAVFSQQFATADAFSTAIDNKIASFESGFASGLMKSAAHVRTTTPTFKTRTDQANEDLLQLLRSGELPAYGSFRWSPMRDLAVSIEEQKQVVQAANRIQLPVVADLWNEDPGTGGGGGGYSGGPISICGIPSGSTAGDIACVVIIVIVIVIIIATKA